VHEIEIHLFLFCNWCPKRPSYQEILQCSKKFDDGPLNIVDLSKRRKKEIISTPIN
jgi:hypothetical protein